MAEGIVPFQDLGKQLLLERCRELEFVDDIEFLKCSRCNRLALELWYTNCGHTLCPNCKRLLSGGRCRCPHCGQFIQHIKEHSADFEEKLNECLAKCPNSRYGCPLVTTVKQLQGHVAGCGWTKKQLLPAVYRGSNTMQMLLEEVRSLKEQMGEMKETNAFLLNELNERLKVEEEIKKSVEMSVEDIKSQLNGLLSDLHYETTSLKVQLKNFDQIKLKELLELKNTLTLDINNKMIILEKRINEINHEKFKDHFVSKDEMIRLQKTMTEMKVSNKLIIQMLDQKEKRFNQKLTKEVKQMDIKIVASEGKMEAALMKNTQEAAAISKDLQGKVENSSEDLKALWQKLYSDSNQRLEQKVTSFKQKLSNEVKQLDEKINKNQTAVKINGKEIHTKMEAVKSELKKQAVELKRKMATNVKNLQEKISESIEETKQQLIEVQSDVTRGFKQEQLHCNQKLKAEIKALKESMRIKEEKIEKKINFIFEKQELAMEICRKEVTSFSKVERQVTESVEKSTEQFNNQFKQMSSQICDKITKMSHDVEKKTEKFKEEIDQSNKKTSKVEKDIEKICNFLLVEDYRTKVKTIQQLNPQLNTEEAFQRGTAIEQLVNRKSSICQLTDSFLFGSAEEQMAIESLCLKWSIKHNDLLIPAEGCYEQLSDIFPVYGHQIKAQLQLTIYSHGDIYLNLCLKDEEREGQEVDIKPLPMLVFIVKDHNGRNKHLITYDRCSFNESLQYNQFGYGSGLIEKSQWDAFICPGDRSLELLVLVEPPAIINRPLSVKGTMMNTIEHYSRKLQMEKEGLMNGHWSPPFLTHAGGYTVVVWMLMNEPIGADRRGLKAWIYFSPGECDSQLRRSFNHKTSVTLINKWDANKSITVDVQTNKTYYYVMLIATHDAISSGGFLVNDSLTYHVKIEPINQLIMK